MRGLLCAVPLVFALAVGGASRGAAASSMADTPTAAAGASVRMIARAKPSLRVEIGDDGPRIQANAAWTVTFAEADGASTISGGPTAGRLLAVPKGATFYSAALD